MVFKTAKNSGNCHFIGAESKAQKNKVICLRSLSIKSQSKNSKPDLIYKPSSALIPFSFTLTCFLQSYYQ